ncbi:MAG: T9SS type B sorting domain-containing protein [Terrimonas sp.]|nr:T9SS type B sorting domain-containing protein [Terrimonas sp.]
MKFFLTFSLFLFFSPIFSQVNLNQGLVAYYPLNGNANDASGNGNTGVLQNGLSFINDKYGNPNSAAYFDGIDDYIAIADNGSFSTPVFSIALWFKSESSALQNLIGKRNYNPNPGQTQYQFFINYPPFPGIGSNIVSSSESCSSFTVSNTSYINTGEPLCPDTWYSAVVTFDGSFHKIYINGVLVKSVATSFTSMAACNAELRIGNWWSGDLIPFKGIIDEVRWYNRALNKDEALALSPFSSNLCSQLDCNNWLYTPSQPSYVNIGDLDVPGNQITVEAVFNATTNNNGFGDLVSKHLNFTDVNYLLRAYSGEISTTDGYYIALANCPVETNKIYHVAMVYDGTSLKFYRNGFLLKQVPASGNLTLNNWQTWIGYFQPQSLNENFIGYINEVRIWNVARTQNEIRTYMNSSLPNPATQVGLLAYYTFDNLLNKQGNPSWNGSLGGNASINSTNPNCSFVVDSCSTVANNDSLIINDYTPVNNFDPCTNIIEVEDAGAFTIGDTVLLIQMKGAIIDSTNTASFGNITDFRNAGNYEFNYIKAINGNYIELLNLITRQFYIPEGKVQMIRVPYYSDYTVDKTLTCLPWDGAKGGVLVFNVQNSLILNQNIDVSERGFRGGAFEQQPSACSAPDFFYSQSSTSAALKGEGIVNLSINNVRGRGKAANGGGGGNDHNAGGAGGGNGGNGGNGGKEASAIASGCSQQIDNGGIGGSLLPYNNGMNKVFMGGGGGAGDVNGQLGGGKGGNGGGIIIITANTISALNGEAVLSNGENVPDCQTNDCWEGFSGGGAGGTIVLSSTGFTGNLNIKAEGGKGGSLQNNNPSSGFNGPGGGGSGGLLWLSNPVIPSNISFSANGGSKGIFINSGDSGGATDGESGISIFNLSLPISSQPFTKNIDSVRIKDSATSCSSFDFQGLAFTSRNPVSSWQWDLGDGNMANTQDVSHDYSIPGNFTVKLIVTDINGCRDSISLPVTTSSLNVNAGNDTLVCKNVPVSLNGNSDGIQYSWSPAPFVSDPTILNPVVSVSTDTWFYLTAQNSLGCVQVDSLLLSVIPDPVFTISPDASTCSNTPVQISAAGGDSYSWQPSNSLSNTGVANPVANPATTTTYTVDITESTCQNSTQLSTTISVLPLPIVVATKGNDIDCTNDESQLSASGAISFLWTPAGSLNNPTLPDPIAKPTTTTQYIVSGTDLNGCVNMDMVTVQVDQTNKGGYLMPSGFTPNNDGLNDCYRIRYWGVIETLEFSIYNRWGERVFFTTNPADCWDGTYKGVKQDSGVFVYMIKAKTSCESEVFRKGTLTLIR